MPSTTTPKPKVEILTIGDELLLGICDNGNLTFISRQLNRYGLAVERNVVVRDHPETLARYFSEAWENAGIVITTGGLGPTRDDLTRDTVARALGRKLVPSREAEQAIREHFAKLDREVTDNNLRQAAILEGAEVIPNRLGTAPGQWLQTDGRILVMLPGPTHELEPMFDNHVLPRLREAGWAAQTVVYLQIRTCGIGESLLEERLAPVLRPLEDRLHTGYCAHAGMVDVRISPKEGLMTWDQAREAAEQCRDLLGADFVCFGSLSMSRLLLRKLRAAGKKLAVAESCTGGLLASAFADIPGASKIFAGGVVCYNNETKIQLLGVPEAILLQHGAVSAECAAAMATGAAEKFEAAYALSVTGFAGPGGGTAENPAGTIFFGYHSPSGVWSHKIVYPGNRMAVRKRAVNTALDWMRRKLEKYETYEILSDLAC